MKTLDKNDRERWKTKQAQPISHRAFHIDAVPSVQSETEKVIYKKMTQLIQKGSTLNEAALALEKQLPDQPLTIAMVKLRLSYRIKKKEAGS